MPNNNSLYGNTPNSTGNVSSSNLTTLYSGDAVTVPSNGNLVVPGTLTVNGCSILTNCTTFNLLPTTATTVNAFGSATNLLIGPNSGYTTINNNLNVNGEYVILNADFSGSPPINPGGTAWAGWIANRGSEPPAYINWIETGVLATSYWEVTSDLIALGDITATSNIFLNGPQITGNSDQTSGTPVKDFYLTNKRGSSPDTSIRWNEATQTWQLTNDGTNYYDIAASGGGGATFGNITIGVYDDNTIASTTGPIKLFPDNGEITATTSNFTANNVFANNAIVSYGQLGANDKTLLLNFDDGTDTNDGFFKINRGGTGAAVSLKWNESTDRWQFTNDGTTYYNMVSNLDDLTDVAITSPVTNQLLKYDGTNWVNTDAINVSSVTLDSRVLKNTSTATYTTTSQQVFGNIPIATYRTVKYTWQISRGTEFQALETLVTHDGTTAYITAFADVRTGANLANFDVDISGSNMRVLVTPTSSASTVLVCDYTLFNI